MPKQPESKSFLNFACINKAPVISINWLLDKDVIFDPTQITLEVIMENDYARLLKPVLRQHVDTGTLSSLLLSALEDQTFSSALALIDLGAKIINDQPLYSNPNGPLPIAVAAMNTDCFDAYLKAYLSPAENPLLEEEITKKTLEVISICFNLADSVFNATYITNQDGEPVKQFTFGQNYIDNLKRLFNSIQITPDELTRLIPAISNNLAFECVLEHLGFIKLIKPTNAQERTSMHYLFDRKDWILPPELVPRLETGDKD